MKQIKMSKLIIFLAIGIILVSFFTSIYFYPKMPDRIASHWNAAGEVDGYMGKGVLFMIPLLLVGLGILFWVIPRIDPLKNIDKFQKYYEGFIVAIFIFMFVVHVMMVLWNLGYMISPNLLMPLGMGVLFYYLGVLSEHAKRNWFVGIRTPWTISSEKVWNKTHKLGAKLFKITAIVTVFGVFFGSYALYFALIPVLSVSLYLVIYSYLQYQK